MPIRVKCGACKKTLSVKDQHAGKKIRCPNCQGVVTVPLVTGQNGTSVPPGNAQAKQEAIAKPPVAAKKPSLDATQKKIGPEVKKALPNPAKPVPEAKQPGADAKKPSANAKNPTVNGKKTPPTPAPKSEPAHPPPEHVEAEALSVFAEDLTPKEADEGPKFIDFTCEWCDQELHLPVELGGKQSQCPNPECRRIVKVPMPKIEAKKDWRKMDRRGPALAIVSQPEQLEDAWGTQEATRARQDSLAKAGAVELPPKPAVGAAGWILRGFYASCCIVALLSLGFVTRSLVNTAGSNKDIAQIEKLLFEKKITDPILVAEANRAIALLYLHYSQDKHRVTEAEMHFGGAVGLADAKDPGVNEQLFLIKLALSQIELGGNEDEILSKSRLPWTKVNKDALAPTLDAIKVPEVRAMAMREVAGRLIERDQGNIALGLAGSSLSAADEHGVRPPVFGQYIALLYLQPGKEEELKKLAPMPDPNAGDVDAHARVGYAEGYARKGEYDKAFDLTKNGPLQDRLQVCVGVASIALAKNKDEATRFVKKGLEIAAEDRSASQWLLVDLARLGARMIDKAAHDEDWNRLDQMIEKRLAGSFQLRGRLELLLARCTSATSPLATDELAPFENDKEGTFMALAWYALAQQHARAGVSRDRIQKVFADYRATSAMKADPEKISPVVEAGSILGR